MNEDTLERNGFEEDYLFSTGDCYGDDYDAHCDFLYDRSVE